MAKTKKHKWTAEEVMDLVRARYDKDGNGASARYVVCEQVAPETGSGASTWIDAMVFSMWPSDGLHREAIEVKVSRSDFLDEVNNPGKNQWFQHNSSMFWYATAPGVVASADEIPEGCGWLLAQKGRLVMKKQARTKHIKALTPDFMASVARAMLKETERQKRVMRDELLKNDPVISLANDAYRTIKDWLQERMPTKGSYKLEFTDTDELRKLLDEAVSGEEDQRLYDRIDRQLRDLRDVAGDMLLKLEPYVSVLLHELEETGEFMHRFGMRGGRYDLLHDLRTKRTRYGKERKDARKERLAKLKVLQELLTEAKEAKEDG